jgi:hypothetical protein
MTQYRTPRSAPAFNTLYGRAISALLGWRCLFFSRKEDRAGVGLANAFIFRVAGVVSASLVAVNKSVSRRFSGVVASAAGGFGLVFAGAFLALVPSQVLFNWFSSTPQPGGPGMDQTASFVATLAGRTLAWSLIGTIIGLGTSLVIGRRGTLLNGIMGGLLGGLMAGMLFDPLQVLISGADKSPWISRMVGFFILGE